MNILVFFLLCIVQGLTEFLPVSSSGHLLLFEQIFKIENNLLLLNLFLHLATLFAVVIVYRKVIWKLIKKPFQPLTYKLLFSTSLTLVFAICYEVLNIDSYVVFLYGFCFLITSALLFLTHKMQKNMAVVKTKNIDFISTLAVGISQGFAVLPGLSRSGTTIATLLLCGNDEDSAAEYSFLLSIPIIVGGFILELLRVENFSSLFAEINPLVYIAGFVLTFVVAFLSLKFTIKLLKKNKFIYFSIYLLILGAGVVLYTFL